LVTCHWSLVTGQLSVVLVLSDERGLLATLASDSRIKKKAASVGLTSGGNF